MTTPKKPANNKSETCSRVQPLPARSARRLANHIAKRKPTKYIKPYQRTARGPIENNTGSILGNCR
ncbi:Uncharacterised protein [Vibrio cholerae]|uniref:Uncharacterized protein n=1 Tax=Vibrio cholerae TaxID=666 RepID=A0A655YCG0_VIBCL|nr:Uncharacterised protein [Vibrio cholerae]